MSSPNDRAPSTIHTTDVNRTTRASHPSPIVFTRKLLRDPKFPPPTQVHFSYRIFERPCMRSSTLMLPRWIIAMESEVRSVCRIRIHGQHSGPEELEQENWNSGSSSVLIHGSSDPVHAAVNPSNRCKQSTNGALQGVRSSEAKRCQFAPIAGRSDTSHCLSPSGSSGGGGLFALRGKTGREGGRAIAETPSANRKRSN